MIDLLFLLVLAIGLPISGHLATRRLELQVADGVAGVRSRFYRGTVALQWVLVAALGVHWWSRGRAAAELGLTIDAGPRFWLAAALAAAGSAVLLLQLRAALRPQAREATARQFEGVEYMLPHDRSEYGWWVALSLTAGVCEQVLYRGFLFWLFEPYLGFWGAAVGAVLLFGLGHVYQGVAGAAKTSIFGAVVMTLYLVGGSLVPPMVLHAVMDLVAGRTALAVLGEGRASGPRRAR